MKKLGVFVEGYTDVVFVERLVAEIAGGHNVLIETRRIMGGASARRRDVLIRAAQPSTGQKYFVLIVDCGGDHQVKSRIMEEHENLTRAGYEKIIGVRDVRPDYTLAEVPRLEAGLRLYIRTSLAPVEFVLAVMEIEAWFLGESTHFARVDRAITIQAIKSKLGFDPEKDDLHIRGTPADDLNDCYQISGKAYRKQDAQVTVGALDFAVIYCEWWKRFPQLERLIRSLDSFLR